jgi:hypothetical protein
MLTSAALGLALAVGGGNGLRLGLAESSSAMFGIRSTPLACEDELLQQFIADGLFELAIERCRQGLAQESAPSIGHWRWQVRWLEILAERDAAQATESTAVLAAAAQQQQVLLEKLPLDLNRLWLEFHFEALRLKIADRIVAFYLAAPSRTFLRDDALKLIREILDRCDQLLTLLNRFSAPADSSRSGGTEASLRDLAALRNRLQLLKIDSYLLRSQGYPPASEDALAAGTDALALIDRLISQIDTAWSGHDSLQLARYRSQVAADQVAEALRGLTQWWPQIVDEAVRPKALALICQLHLRRQEIDQAAAWLARREEDRSPDLALAALELAILQSQSSSGSQHESSLQQILTLKEEIARRFGNYWGQRAEALIVGSEFTGLAGRTTSDASSLELLRLDIRQQIAAANWPAALDKLASAEAIALRGNDPQQAFAFAKTAIGVHQKWGVATGRETSDWVVLALAKSRIYASQPEAAAIHQAAVIEFQQRVSRALAETAAEPDELQRQLELLQKEVREHAVLWPESPAADAMKQRWQLLQLASGELSPLLDSDRSHGGPGNPLPALDAVSWMVLTQFFLESDAPSPSSPSWSIDVLQLQQATRLSGEEWSAFEAAVRWLAADFDGWLVDGGISWPLGQPLPLNASVRGEAQPNLLAADEPLDLRTYAFLVQRLLRLAQHSRSADEAELVRLVDRLLARHATMPQLSLGSYGLLQLQLGNILRLRATQGWEESDKRTWQALVPRLMQEFDMQLAASKAGYHPRLAQAIRDCRDLSMARYQSILPDSLSGQELLEQYRQREPRRGLWTLELARLLESRNDTQLSDAIGLYRQVANGTPVGQPLWLEARWSTIRCLERLGQVDEAKQLRALVRAMVPALPGPWQQRLQ